MSNKNTALYNIVDIVVECCSNEINGISTLTRDDILGNSKKENHAMSRAILALQLYNEGFSVTTIALLLNRKEQSVRKLIKAAYDYIKTSRACRIAAAEIVLRCKEIEI